MTTSKKIDELMSKLTHYIFEFFLKNTSNEVSAYLKTRELLDIVDILSVELINNKLVLYVNNIEPMLKTENGKMYFWTFLQDNMQVNHDCLLTIGYMPNNLSPDKMYNWKNDF